MFDILTDVEGISAYLSAAMATDLARQVFLFSLAAWIHSGRVKKAIKSEMGTLIAAVNSAEEKFGVSIKHLDNRVIVLENKNKQGE